MDKNNQSQIMNTKINLPQTFRKQHEEHKKKKKNGQPSLKTITITNYFSIQTLKFPATTNTVKHHMKPRDMYNQTGVYQLKCNECPLKYTGQTRCTFKVCYREHINAIRTNRLNSKFAQHVLETGHNHNTRDQTMEILHIEKKGPKLNTLERFHIYTT
jgi:hypothetical protein